MRKISLKICGITNSQSVKTAYKNRIKSLGFASNNLNGPNTSSDEKIKILINNAGITCPNLSFEDITNDIINSIVAVNLVAPVKIISALHKNLDHVININSMVGLEAKKNRLSLIHI